jgi:hypothetical protein
MAIQLQKPDYVVVYVSDMQPSISSWFSKGGGTDDDK